ncbi:uncharacterized protein [Paramormyrops kingsleyae]|uniref:uncharacterized protein isoform X2 n=1 Tax=Paramormyrops kingsleyae TaxID=1676925 RepID=UPI003B96C5FC
MDTVVLSSLLNGVLLLVCLGLLLSFCVSCGQSWRQTSIHQSIQDDVYNPGDFRVVRPMATVDTNVPRPGVSNPAISLTPAPSSLKSPSPEPERRPSNTPTEDDDDYVNGGNGYIFVLPGVTPEVLPATISSMQKNGSQQSLTSGDEDYVNGCLQKPEMRSVPHDNSLPNPKPPEDPTLDEPDSENYINMPEHEKGGLTPGKSQESMESDGNGSTDYVNTSPK